MENKDVTELVTQVHYKPIVWKGTLGKHNAELIFEAALKSPYLAYVDGVHSFGGSGSSYELCVGYLCRRLRELHDLDTPPKPQEFQFTDRWASGFALSIDRIPSKYREGYKPGQMVNVTVTPIDEP